VDDLLLLQYIRTVAKLADPARPQHASQRAFDAAKQDATYADLPSARVIARRLGKRWREVLILAHSSSKHHATSLSGRQGENHQPWITGEHIAYALKLVAQRLSAPTLSESQYEAERDKLLKEHKRQHPRSSRLRLPTADQICIYTQRELRGTTSAGTSRVGAWPRAMELAELAPNRKPTRQATRTTSVPIALLERYYDAHKAGPTASRLATFARKQDIPHTMIRNKAVWNKALKAWYSDRERRGLPAPADPPPATASEQRLAALNFRQAGTLPTTRWANKDKCVLAVTRYLRQIPQGEYATVDGYQRWARQQRFATPPLGALERHGGWDTIRVLAHKRMMKATTQAATKPDRAALERA
jgi:hypothetical protein